MRRKGKSGVSARAVRAARCTTYPTAVNTAPAKAANNKRIIGVSGGGGGMSVRLLALAGRIACLMTGDREAILRLYQEMIGEAEPEDLSGVWAVRLGEATEALFSGFAWQLALPWNGYSQYAKTFIPGWNRRSRPRKEGGAEYTKPPPERLRQIVFDR
jgi:hypothetical protein